LVSESTRNECQDILFREIDTVHVKGKHNATRLFQPLCSVSDSNADMDNWLLKHKRALEAYNNSDSETAIKEFKTLRTMRPKDGYYSAMIKKMEVSIV